MQEVLNRVLDEPVKVNVSFRYRATTFYSTVKIAVIGN